MLSHSASALRATVHFPTSSSLSNMPVSLSMTETVMFASTTACNWGVTLNCSISFHAGASVFGSALVFT